MKVLILFVVFISFFLTERLAEGTSKNRCDELPKDQIDFQTLVLNSPYFIYRTSTASQQCAVGIATGLVGDHSINNIVTRGTQILSNLNFTLDASKTNCTATSCSSNISSPFQFIVSTKFWCPYICSTDGITLWVIRCYGRNSADEIAIGEYLFANARKIPGYANIINSQTNCNHTLNCPAFNV